MYSEDELLALSGIQHMAFCPRQWALIHIEQLWSENVKTVEGRLMHDKADNPFLQESRGSVIIARSIPLASYSLGLYGIADVVEFKRALNGSAGIVLSDYDGVWIPHPVEYKRGRPKQDERDKVQLCSQAICLEEMYGTNIACGSLYYGETRHREHIVFDRELRCHVRTLAITMHQLFKDGKSPKANYARRCSQCSLVDLCMPKLTMKELTVKQYLENAICDNRITDDP